MLDTHNKTRLKGNASVYFRKMPIHDVNLIKSINSGHYYQEPQRNLDTKSNQVHFQCWWPLVVQEIKYFLAEKQKLDAENTVEQSEANIDKKRSYIAVATPFHSLECLRNNLANFISDVQAMYIYTIPGKTPFSEIYANVIIDWTLEEETINWYEEINTMEART